MIDRANNLSGKIAINITVNGNPRSLLIDPDTVLLNLLRDDLRLTGTKHGCDDANCGTCTVLLNGQAVKSCALLAVQADGGEIATIEGLIRVEDGKEILHPLQQAFIDTGAVQCGFCIPGMIMTAKSLLDESTDVDEADIREALHGNICRCTGYVKIVEAVEKARDMMKEEGKQ